MGQDFELLGAIVPSLEHYHSQLLDNLETWKDMVETDNYYFELATPSPAASDASDGHMSD